MVTTTLRIEDELYEKIVKLAEEEKRSVNSEIVYILEKFIKEKKD